jgi:peptidyl-prolyl cis-trans isomerase C
LSNVKYKPSKFEEVARNNSVCPSKSQGGDFGKFSEGQMVTEFEEACETAKIGKIVDPVKTQFGYHIIRVDERISSRIKNIDEVYEEIKNKLLSQKQKEIFDAYVEALRKEFKVKIYLENL